MQLKTVPSCELHNNGKSGDDQYLLAHITMHAANRDNLAKQVFIRSIAPQLKRREPFRAGLAAGSVPDEADGAVLYRVDSARFDRFFDSLAAALYFDYFKQAWDAQQHVLHHVYLDLTSQDPEELARKAVMSELYDGYSKHFSHLTPHFKAAQLEDVVFQWSVIAPARTAASITIVHTFYDVFRVISLFTKSPSMLFGHNQDSVTT